MTGPEPGARLIRHGTIGFCSALALLSLEARSTGVLGAVALAWVGAWLWAPLAWGAARLGGRIAPRGRAWIAGGAVAAAAALVAAPHELVTAWPVWAALAALPAAVVGAVRLSARSRRHALALVPVVLALHLGDRSVLPDLYPSLHLAAGLLALALGALVVERLLPRVPRAVLVGLHGGGAVALAAALWGGIAAGTRAEAAARDGLQRSVLLVAWALSDLDGDGASSVLGGADCAPLDPARGPHADDVPGDGVDQDCSGSDRRPPAAPPPRAARLPRPAGVLLVTADSLRADAVGAYGGPSTPQLDRLAAQGRRFARAYAGAPETRLSFEIALGGRYPFVPGPPATPLGTLLRAAGRPAVVIHSANELTGTVAALGFEALHVPGDSDATVAAALPHLARLRADGGLLWVHCFDPHAPYDAVPGLAAGSSPFERYLSEVGRWDRALGRLLGAAGPDLAVIVTSDHGEAFGEHATRYHRTSLYDEQIRVPLIVRAPGGAPGVSHETVGLVDLHATITDLLDLPRAAGGHGRSLVPALAGQPLDPWLYRATTLALHGELGPPARWRGVFLGPHKLLVSLRWNLLERYDVSRDPGELRPLPEDALPRELRAAF